MSKSLQFYSGRSLFFACPTSFLACQIREPLYVVQVGPTPLTAPATLLDAVTTTHPGTKSSFRVPHTPQSKGTKDLCYLKSTVVWGLKSAGRKGRYTVFSIGSLICMKTKQTFSLHKSRGWFGARHILLPHSCDSTGEKVTCFASVAFCTRLGHNVTSVRRQTWWRGAVSLAAPGRHSSMGVREGHCGD